MGKKNKKSSTSGDDPAKTKKPKTSSTCGDDTKSPKPLNKQDVSENNEASTPSGECLTSPKTLNTPGEDVNKSLFTKDSLLSETLTSPREKRRYTLSESPSQYQSKFFSKTRLEAEFDEPKMESNDLLSFFKRNDINVDVVMHMDNVRSVALGARLQFKNEEDLKQALSFNGLNLRDKQLSLKVMSGSKTRLEAEFDVPDMTEEDLVSFFKDREIHVEVDMYMKNFKPRAVGALLKFKSETDLEKTLLLNGGKVRGKPVFFKHVFDRERPFSLDGLDDKTIDDDESFKEELTKQLSGVVQHIHLPRDSKGSSKGYGFILLNVADEEAIVPGEITIKGKTITVKSFEPQKQLLKLWDM